LNLDACESDKSLGSSEEKAGSQNGPREFEAGASAKFETDQKKIEIPGFGHLALLVQLDIERGRLSSEGAKNSQETPKLGKTVLDVAKIKTISRSAKNKNRLKTKKK
jgi:hypothetical protein